MKNSIRRRVTSNFFVFFILSVNMPGKDKRIETIFLRVMSIFIYFPAAESPFGFLFYFSFLHFSLNSEADFDKMISL